MPDGAEFNMLRQYYRDGSRIRANYLGDIVTGRVESSRVAYGGYVQHTVVLDRPVKLRWRNRDELTCRLLINDKEVLEIL